MKREKEIVIDQLIKRSMTKTLMSGLKKFVNSVIVGVEKALNWVASRLWIPGWIRPPKYTQVEFTSAEETQKGLVFSGQYDGTFNDYPMKLQKVTWWRLKGEISLPKLQIQTDSGRFSGIMTHIVGGTEASNWVTQQKHLKARQKDPLYTTLPDKKKKVDEYKDQKKETQERLREELPRKARERFDKYLQQDPIR